MCLLFLCIVYVTTKTKKSRPTDTCELDEIKCWRMNREYKISLSSNGHEVMRVDGMISKCKSGLWIF